MAFETRTWLVLHVLVLFVTCFMQHCFVNGQTPPVPCLFVFGDSLSDNGNSNNLLTNAKANYVPYGVDFPRGTTGRFTNGRTAIDIIGELLGISDFIPPFANIVGSDILKGANYASGAAGIRAETGKHMGANIEMGLQVANHRVIVSQIVARLGGLPQAQQYLKQCLYYVNIGSNDYINNYYLPRHPTYTTSRNYNPEEYAQVLINQASGYLQDLRESGARKFVLVGIGQIGCTPFSIAKANQGTQGCVEKYNADALIFSLKLRSLVDQLNGINLDSKYIFVNSTAGSIDSSLGFTVLDKACCLPRSSDGMCVPNSRPCLNRNEYAFYDAIHPTSAVNNLTALTSYDSTLAPETTSPMDIKRLAMLSIS
ncbi:GDSL esterase/lipase At1g29670-like [Trifolium pratense]|uniref:GDSL esterase/lipase At1g29670-like n=1 Tax=Trifolium pratense TaxID=57577 RepID=UPI001E693466|nr:GDSL esterase/lipase At1g29670-like [Trifolium pratense]